MAKAPGTVVPKPTTRDGKISGGQKGNSTPKTKNFGK